MRTLTTLVLSVAALAASPAAAQRLPSRTVPPSVMLEVRNVEAEFRAALAKDCASDRCSPQGCVYENHLTLDQPRSASLPGLPAEEGPGAVVAQEYLTRARCEFSHEKTVSTKDIQRLVSRLEKRLSHGWLRVAVTPEELEPIPKSLSEPEPEEPEEEPEEEVAEEEVEPEPEPEPDEGLTAGTAISQLWDSMLPHFPWMVAIFLLTLSIFVVIWAGRRLGATSLEERMLEAQLAGGAPGGAEPAHGERAAEESASSKAEDEDFAAEQEALWLERIERIDPEDDDVIARLLREWLKAGEYPTLARALFVFGDRVSHAFESDPDLALKKVEFAEYFRDVDEEDLPSRAAFFRRLNQQAMASLLLSQEDVHLYRALREDFGATGLAGLMREMPSRHGALLFALVPWDKQIDVAKLLPNDLRAKTAQHLLQSTRLSKTESDYIFECVAAARDGEDLPEPPRAAVRDRGAPIDSASALSALLPQISGEQRAALFEQAIEQLGGAVPDWYEDILFNHMLTLVGDEQRNDLLLEVDIRALAGWLSMQQPAWRDALVSELSEPLQRALDQSSAFSSRPERLRWARRGHTDLVAALKSRYARSQLRFVDLVA